MASQPYSTGPMTIQKLIAKEWLFLLLFIAIGLVTTYILFYAQSPIYEARFDSVRRVTVHEVAGYEIGTVQKLFRHLSSPVYSRSAWAAILCPYFIFMFCRSVAWALRTIQNDKSQRPEPTQYPVDESEQSQPRKRPVLVWVISIFVVVSVGFALYSLARIYSGTIPLSGAQKSYFRSLSPLDYGLSVLLDIASLLGAIHLFFLNRQSYYWFIASFVGSLALTFYHTLTKNWLDSISDAVLVGVFVAWGLNLAIIAYLKKLIIRSVLQ